MSKELRVVRIPMAIELIRRMDRLLLDGVGGYETRAAFIADAVDSMIVDLSFEPAPPEPAQQIAEQLKSTARIAFNAEDIQPSPAAVKQGLVINLEDTRLGNLPHCRAATGVAIVKDETLFGLHNRDYPSLWLARKLADFTGTDLVPAKDFAREAVKSAWEYAARLVILEKQTGKKLAALFPKNADKRDRASDAFREFALGTWRFAGDELIASGPLFAWRLLQLENRANKVYIGLTPEAVALLPALSDLSLDMPHQSNHASLFLTHLKKYAKADWAGFETILRACSTRVSRAEIMAAFSARHPSWSETLVATNTSGYIARAREWGLLEEGTVKRQYRLTEFGSNYLAQLGGQVT